MATRLTAKTVAPPLSQDFAARVAVLRGGGKLSVVYRPILHRGGGKSYRAVLLRGCLAVIQRAVPEVERMTTLWVTM